MIKSNVLHYSSMLEKLEKLCFIAVLNRKQKLLLLVHIKLEQSFEIDLYSCILFIMTQGIVQ